MSYFQANPIKSTFPILFLIPSLCVVYQHQGIMHGEHRKEETVFYQYLSSRSALLVRGYLSFCQ